MAQKFLLIIVLILANSFFVTSEFAMVRVRKTRLEQLAGEGNSTAKVALKLTNDINNMLAASQLGITLASVGLGWVGAKTIDKLLAPIVEPLLKDILPFESFAFCALITFILSFLIVTFLEVLVGEQLPKCIALQNTERAALMVARPMRITMKIFRPFVWFLSMCSNSILKLFKMDSPCNDLVHSTEELDMLVHASYNEGVLNETEAEMLHNMFKFSDLTAKQVMIPRTDMMCIENITPMEEIKKITAENQYTRYPVFEDTLDKILGFVHVKDLYTLSLSGKKKLNLQEILRPIILIPETMTLDNLIIEFKKRKSQIGIVVDEFGGTSGLITLEDVLEEIVGEVQDEFDEDEEMDIKEVSPNIYVANAMMRIDEIAEFFGIEENKFAFDDVETIGGLFVKIQGRLAQVGDVVEIEEQGLKFSVQKVDGARITRLVVEKTPKETDEEKSTEE